MKSVNITTIGEHRGSPRLYLEGNVPARGGFLPGKRYEAVPNQEKHLLELRIVENGMRMVSKKLVRGKEVPIIDINNKDLLEVFDGLDSVRVVIQADRIFILPVASELRAKDRLQRLRARLKNGEKLTVGSLSFGIGVLDSAAHEGLKQSGIESHLAFANEIREDCVEHAVDRNSVIDDETILLTGPLQEFAFDEWVMSRLPSVSILVAGLPCSGASVAGRSKLGLAHPEDHPGVGHLAVGFLSIIARVSPALVILENVIPYASSASASIIRSQLRDLGYDVHETQLDSADFNMLEQRKRFALVAVTRGIEFSFDGLKKPEPRARTFGEIMDDVPLDHSTWGSIDYLWKKQERDSAAGKGFAPTVVDASSTKLPVLNKSLHKRQSTGTFIRHPVHENLYRIPTVAEHARAKGIDPALVADTTQTFGHETCGQSISVPPFVSLFAHIGEALLRFKEADPVVLEQRRWGVAA